MEIFRGIRPTDVVLTVALAACAVWIAVENVQAGPGADVAHPLDSHSVLMVPVFVLAVLPILFRRRAVIPAIAISTLVVLASLPAFGWVTRCGFGLPLTVAFAYAVARFAGPAARQIVGLVAVLALQTVVLVLDSSTGGLIALTTLAPLAAVFYGAGRLVNLLVRRRVVTPTLTRERSNA